MEFEYEDFDRIKQKSEGDKGRIELTSEMLDDNGSISIELRGRDSSKTNSRCVSVDTISIAPGGHNKKKEVV